MKNAGFHFLASTSLAHILHFASFIFSSRFSQANKRVSKKAQRVREPTHELDGYQMVVATSRIYIAAQSFIHLLRRETVALPISIDFPSSHIPSYHTHLLLEIEIVR